jgi:SAM-dependent methyltransferase
MKADYHTAQGQAALWNGRTAQAWIDAQSILDRMFKPFEQRLVEAVAGRAAKFEPASFDMIVSRFGVMFFDDPVAAFANLRRGARKGGQLCCFVWRGAADNPFMTAAERAAAPFLPELPARKPDAPGQFGFADRARVERILTQAGWRGIRIASADIPCTILKSELHAYVTRLGPVGMVLQDADAQTRAKVVEAVRAAFDPFVRGEEVHFTAACWEVRAGAS